MPEPSVQLPLVPESTTDPAPAPDWRASLPEDLKAAPALADFKDLATLAKSYVETKKMVGSALRAPAPDATDEEFDKFYKAGGRPDKPTDYKLNLPAEMEISKEDIEHFRARAHALGLNERQANRMLSNYAEEILGARRAAEREARETDEKLKEEWGGNYKRNMALIERALDQIDPEKKLRSGLNLADPAVIRYLHNESKKLVEGGLIVGDVAGMATRQEAIAKIAEINTDASHPYHKSKPGDPIHEEVSKIYKLAYE